MKCELCTRPIGNRNRNAKYCEMCGYEASYIKARLASKNGTLRNTLLLLLERDSQGAYMPNNTYQDALLGWNFITITEGVSVLTEHGKQQAIQLLGVKAA